MASLKQTIVDAVLRVVARGNDQEFKTSEAARDEFIRLLIAELFPESPEMPGMKAESVEIPVLEEAAPERKVTLTKQRAKPGPKPKPKPEGPVNIEKLNPTQTKKLKVASEEAKVDLEHQLMVEVVQQE